MAGLAVALSGAGVLAQTVAAEAAPRPAATSSPSTAAGSGPASTPAATRAPAATHAPAAATALPPGSLTPLVDCIVDAPLSSAATSRTVLLGYRNSAASTLRVASAAGTNAVAPGAPDHGQPTVFEPGEHHAVWSLTLDARAVPSATWRLAGASATIDGRAPSCDTVSTLALSAPRIVAAGSTVTVTAAVGRLFLAPPSGGSVVFAVDGSAPVSVPVASGGVARTDLPAPAAGDHSVTARFVPAAGSALSASTAGAPLTVTSASGALGVTGSSLSADGTTATVTVGRASGAGSASVDFTTADGTAIAGTDYTASRGTLAFRDGQTTATIDVPLAARPAGAPASTFFVLLQRATTTVDAASATIALPAAAVAPAGAAVVGTPHASGPAGDSLLPAADPTSPSPVAHANDLAMLLGAALLTGGGILGVVGLVRFGSSRDARA